MPELIKELFGVSKPVIAMAHFQALPGTPRYDAAAGIEGILDCMQRDVIALLEGGGDGLDGCQK